MRGCDFLQLAKAKKPTKQVLCFMSVQNCQARVGMMLAKKMFKHSQYPKAVTMRDHASIILRIGSENNR